MRSIANDVNVFIGYYISKDRSHDLCEKFFQKIKNIEKYVVLETVRLSFKHTLSSWRKEAIRIIINSVERAEKDIKNRSSTVELTERIYYSYVKKNFEEFLKEVENKEKVMDEINKIIGKYSVFELRSTEKRKELLKEDFELDVSSDLMNILKDFDLDKKVFFSEISKLGKIMEKYEEKLKSFGMKDYEDRKIASELLALYSQQNIPEYFITNDLEFEKELKFFAERENIKIETSSLKDFLIL
jgi:predicted nucleic acid-binding protein